MDTAAIARAFAESDESFRDQFKRGAPEYHNGIPTPVPLNGARVPESMSGGPANWQDLPEAQAAIEPEYPPEYHKAMETYDMINMMKRNIAVLNKPVEMAMRVRLQYKGAMGDDKTAMESRWKGEEGNRDGALAAAQESLNLCDQSEISDRTRSAVAEVVEMGKFNFEDRETFGEYMTLLQRCNQTIFADQKKLLAKIKDIKKASRNGAGVGKLDVASQQNCQADAPLAGA